MLPGQRKTRTGTRSPSTHTSYEFRPQRSAHPRRRVACGKVPPRQILRRIHSSHLQRHRRLADRLVRLRMLRQRHQNPRSARRIPAFSLAIASIEYSPDNPGGPAQYPSAQTLPAPQYWSHLAVRPAPPPAPQPLLSPPQVEKSQRREHLEENSADAAASPSRHQPPRRLIHPEVEPRKVLFPNLPQAIRISSAPRRLDPLRHPRNMRRRVQPRPHPRAARMLASVAAVLPFHLSPQSGSKETASADCPEPPPAPAYAQARTSAAARSAQAPAPGHADVRPRQHRTSHYSRPHPTPPEFPLRE